MTDSPHSPDKSLLVDCCKSSRNFDSDQKVTGHHHHHSHPHRLNNMRSNIQTQIEPMEKTNSYITTENTTFNTIPGPAGGISPSDILESMINEEIAVDLDTTAFDVVPTSSSQQRQQQVVPENTARISIQAPNNFKKRAKRSSSTTSSDIRDKFKTRSLVEPSSYETSPSTSCKNYSLCPNNSFTKDFKEFTHSIKLINSKQFANAINWYHSHDLPPVEKMFPWLHGLHKYNIAQTKFLLQHIHKDSKINPQQVPIEDVRFLTLVKSPLNSIHDDRILKGTIGVEDILLPLQTKEMAKLRDLLNSAFIMLKLKETDDFNRDVLIHDCLMLRFIPVFKEMDPINGVSLRNFHIQTCKIGHISDFVVYCFNSELHRHQECHCYPLARLLRIAQLKFQRDHVEIPFNNYSVFILEYYDPIRDPESLMTMNTSAAAEQEMLSSREELEIFKDWGSNSIYKEKLEISKMSSATHVYRNVWFGNALDFETYNQLYSNEANIRPVLVEHSPLVPNNSPPLYCAPHNTITTITAEHLQKIRTSRQEQDNDPLITKPKQNWRMFINCYDGGKLPSLSELREYLVHHDDDYHDDIYLEFPPSGSIAIGDLKDEQISSIINVCKLLYFKCGNSAKNKFSGLIYCQDGYSESSLLAHCFLMYSQNLTVDQAILKLHIEYGRPFFIFKSDYVLLERLQTFLLKYSPAKPGYMFEADLDSFDRKVMLSLFTPKKTKKRVFFRITDRTMSTSPSVVPPIAENDDDDGDDDISEPSSNDDDDDSDEDSTPSSICASTFGSLPSRILPHLYLGSLNHANSLPLLNELGITKVVSVGETLKWASDYDFTVRSSSSGCHIMDLVDTKSCDPLVKDPCQVHSIMHITNINDDGIGTLTKTINDALDFIDDSYIKQEKVLVHCQVGVSRSATVCIAEVMKRLNITLMRAYLYVRVRRLNVIIQPNLKLTYELFKWEESVVKQRNAMRISSKEEHLPKSMRINLSQDAETSKDRSSFNSLFSTGTATKNSFSRSSLSTSASSMSGSLDSSIDKAFFSFRVKDNSYQTLKVLSKNQVFISDDEAEADELEDEDGTESDRSGTRTLKNETQDLSEEPEFLNDLITNNKTWVREVDWAILSKEIYNLNKAYITPV